MNKSNIPHNEKRWCVCTLMVRGGSNTIISKELHGDVIEKLENILEEIGESEK